MPRKAILIRLLIFVPLFAYFGYGAVQKWRAEQAEAPAELAPEGTTRTMQLGDGRTIEILEITPEQAERLHGIKVDEAGPPASRDEPPRAAD